MANCMGAVVILLILLPISITIVVSSRTVLVVDAFSTSQSFLSPTYLRQGKQRQRSTQKSPFPAFDMKNAGDLELSVDEEKTDDDDVLLLEQQRQRQQEDEQGLNTVSRVVASSDGKLPSSSTTMMKNIPSIAEDTLQKMDAIYHAMAHKETSQLKYLQNSDDQKANNLFHVDGSSTYDDEEEEKLVSVIKSSLEDGGFELLSRRDLDLCDALNVGYLLRLSIEPEIKSLDPIVGTQFYPTNDDDVQEELLFDGRVLVFRRGYSAEISRGRLILPKLDYLQTSIVQGTASNIADACANFERKIKTKITRSKDSSKQKVQSIIDQKKSDFIGKVQNQVNNTRSSVPLFVKNKILLSNTNSSETKKDNNNTITTAIKNNNEDNQLQSSTSNTGSSNKIMNLGRYGGSKVRYVNASDGSRDALTPFLLSDDSGLSGGTITCDYDMTTGHEIDDDVDVARMDTSAFFQLLERVSISNVVDFFSSGGRKRLIKSLLAKSELVEPTYDEVVVIWRPLPDKKTQLSQRRSREKVVNPITAFLPKALYDVAEIFEVEDRLPKKPAPLPNPKPLPLEMRIFTSVPMANLPAVLPKTRLIFRPADALVFDLVNVFSLLAVLATQRFDNPKLDIIALVSVSLWLIRTILRYSNKLARYDLLVNKFLTSKLSQRGAGALNYIVTEASSQRALRASLVHTWLDWKMKAETWASNITDDRNYFDADEDKDTSTPPSFLSRETLELNGNGEISNEFLCSSDDDSGDGWQHAAKIDISAALNDLAELNLIGYNHDGRSVTHVKDAENIMDQLKTKWVSLFDDDDDDDDDDSIMIDNSDADDDEVQQISAHETDGQDIGDIAGDKNDEKISTAVPISNNGTILDSMTN